MLDVSVKANSSRYYFLNEHNSDQISNRSMHYLDEPLGVWDGKVKGRLGYQMQFAVDMLESQLLKEGNPHVLRLKCDGARNPQRWVLYADGIRVAQGTGEFALECFYERADAFLDLCRDAVETEERLHRWTGREYLLLKSMQDIAQAESTTQADCITQAESVAQTANITQTDSAIIAQNRSTW